jgi:hypothetical protein
MVNAAGDMELEHETQGGVIKPDELHGCDVKLKEAVRALKASMHFPLLSLDELAHDCVVVYGLAAALEGLELAPPSPCEGLSVRQTSADWDDIPRGVCFLSASSSHQESFLQ